MDKILGGAHRKYLLILSCSERKKAIPKAEALDLYDGQFFRILRKNMPPKLDVLILSAKYGLIKSDEYIEHYDQIMSITRAEELAEAVKTRLSKIMEANCYNGVFVNLGKTYMIALERSKEILDIMFLTLSRKKWILRC